MSRSRVWGVVKAARTITCFALMMMTMASVTINADGPSTPAQHYQTLNDAGDVNAKPLPMRTSTTPPAGRAARHPMRHEMWSQGRPTAEPEVRRQSTFDPGIPYQPTHLCTRLIVPKEAKLSLYRGDGTAVGSASTSTLAAMRTRARYAFSIDAGRDYQGRQFFGTIDVVRGPRFPRDVDPKTAAIPIVFTDEDLIQLSRDRMIVKYIVLEDPELALDYPSTEEQPIRYDATFDPDAVQRAKKLGKILIAVYLGNRIPNLDERVGITREGTLLISKSLSIVNAKGESRELDPEFVLAEQYPHGAVQQVSFGCAAGDANVCQGGGATNAVGDSCATCPPTSGPGVNPVDLLNNDSTDGFEYLCDGGDRRPRVGWVNGGEIINIDPEDTVAEYRTEFEGKRLTASNRICIFAPRYVEVRVVQMVDGYDSAIGYASMIRERKADAFTAEARGHEQRVYRSPEIVRHEKRLKGIEGTQWAGDFYEVRVLAGYEQGLGWASLTGLQSLLEVSDAMAPELLKRTTFAETLTLERMPEVMAMVAGTGEVVAHWETKEIRRVDTREGNSLLVIEKSADRSAAKVGEEVTFVIRYTNKGTQPVSNITVVDSLVTRLDYVPESADSDRPAVFTTRMNNADSVELRWEIKDPLPPGESGMVKFVCRIR